MEFRLTGLRRRLDFHHHVGMRQARYLYQGQGRRRRHRSLQPSTALPSGSDERYDICHEDGKLHDVTEPGATRLKHVFQIGKRLSDLHRHVAGADKISIFITRRNSGREQKLAGCSDTSAVGIGDSGLLTGSDVMAGHAAATYSYV